jgi:two-component system, NtrC family, response regulator HydG
MPTRILFVDDQQDICDVVAMTLERLGYDVTAVTSASEALDRFDVEDFDVVLTDLGLAEMTGIRLCEHIRGTRPGTPVVIMSGHSNAETAIRAMRAGALDYLVKPVDFEQLETTVARAARHGQLRALATPHGDAPSARKVDVVGRSAA